MTSVAPCLACHSLNFAWQDKPALNCLDLSVHQGELFGLLGPNGAGKTTLISLIAGLIQSPNGRIQFLGNDLSQSPARARAQMGFVFQSISLDRFMTVEDNLRFACGLQGMSNRQATRAIERTLHNFPITPWLGRTVAALSGGQKRLVDIARATIHQPQLLILDEPTTALDVISKEGVWNSLKSLRQHSTLTILVSTHLMDEASSCDRVAFLNHGKLIWQGTPTEALAELPAPQLELPAEPPKYNLKDWFMWKVKQHGGAP